MPATQERVLELGCQISSVYYFGARDGADARFSRWETAGSKECKIIGPRTLPKLLDAGPPWILKGTDPIRLIIVAQRDENEGGRQLAGD